MIVTTLIPTLINPDLLKTAVQTTPFKQAFGHRRRSGKNGVSNLSVYNYCRIDNWHSELLAAYNDAIPGEIKAHLLQASILHLPTGGHLDLQNYWHDRASTDNRVEMPNIACFISIALTDNQLITYEDTKQNHAFNAGDAIVFLPETLHEIKTVAAEQYWLVNIVSRTAAEQFLASLK